MTIIRLALILIPNQIKETKIVNLILILIPSQIKATKIVNLILILIPSQIKATEIVNLILIPIPSQIKETEIVLQFIGGLIPPVIRTKIRINVSKITLVKLTFGSVIEVIKRGSLMVLISSK